MKPGTIILYSLGRAVAVTTVSPARSIPARGARDLSDQIVLMKALRDRRDWPVAIASTHSVAERRITQCACALTLRMMVRVTHPVLSVIPVFFLF